MPRLINLWDKRFLLLAEHISTWSRDPSTKVGAVITDDDHRVISVGFNGLPKGVKDLPERYNNRELKYPRIVHAEINAILFAKSSLVGCTLYTWPFLPCSICSGPVIQVGIKRVIAPFNDNPRWADNFKISREMFGEAEVELVEVKNG